MDDTPTDEELDGFIEGYLSDGMDWWYDKEIVRGLARALLEHFGRTLPELAQGLPKAPCDAL